MKKTLTIAILVALLGILAGAGSAMVRLARVPWNGDPGGKGNNPYPAEEGSSADSVPRIVVDKVEYDFGVMDQGAKGSHAFVFKNTGKAPLELTTGNKSCGCTSLEIERTRIPPDQSTTVTVVWNTNKTVGNDSEMAEIYTNDPKRPRVTLTVKGYVVKAVQVVPQSLVVGSVSADEAATGEVDIYCFLDDPFEISGHGLHDSETADKFEITFEPLSVDELEKQPDAHCGYRARVTVKPGLPMGTIRQTIKVQTNLKSSNSDSGLEIEIPVDGTIHGDIAIYGRGWNNASRVLEIGPVSSDEGAQSRLLLVTRGPYHKDVEFECVSGSTETLDVRVGETIQLGTAATSQTPLLIEIPKRSRPVNHLMSEEIEPARIRIKTTHPRIPELTILVSYAVEG